METVGIHHGVKKNLFDYKMVSSNLRKYFPEITWAAVKLQGTRLFIDLKENSDSSIFEERTQKGGNLIADADGTIKKMITRSGTPAVSVGMEVKKGDLLVSGVVDLINDAGEVYEQAAVIPDADIYIQTFINYNDNVPLIQKKKQYTGKSRRRGLLQIRKIMIGFPFFSKTFDHYDMIVNRKQFRLMENFYLPIYYSDFQIREYRICQVSISKNHAETQLKHNLDLFLKKIEEKVIENDKDVLDSLKNELILAVDEYISKKSPKANNSISASIVEHGLNNNIDICFIMSQTQLETNFGAAGVGKESSRRSLFGVIKKKYPSYDAAIEDYTRLLKKSYLVKGRDEHFLMKNYITGSGYRYAAAIDYEQKLSKIYKSITKSTEIDELQKLFDSI